MQHAKVSTPLTMDLALQAALEIAEMGVWGWDEVAQVKLWPNQTKAIFGLPRETEMTRELFVSMLHPDDVCRYREAWAAAIRPDGDRTYQLVYRIRRAGDGAERWINSKARVEFEGEKPVRVIGALRDVTAEQETLEKLNKSRRQLSHFIAHAPAAIAMFDADMRYIAASDQWNVTTGQAATPVGRCHYDVTPYVNDAWKEIYRRCLAGAVESSDGEPVLHKNGAIRWIKWEARPWRDDQNEVGGVLISSEDITERKADEKALRDLLGDRMRAEAALRESEAAMRLSENRLRHAADAGGLTYAEFNLVNGRLHLADNYAKVMGYQPITPLSGGGIDAGMAFFADRIAELDRAAFMQAAGDLFAEGKTGRIEYRVIGDDGRERWIESVANAEAADDGQPKRAFVTHLDITAQVENRHALAVARDKADEILASIADGFYALDANWRFVYFNARAEAMLGKRREEITGRNFFDVFPAVEGTEVHGNYKKVMREKQPLEFDFISPILRRWVAFSVYPTNEGGVSVYFRDISAQKAIDEQLVAAKSEAERANRSKSKFLAAASHDLRQPVQSLVLLLSLIERQVAANPKAVETAQMMKQALGGLNGLLTSILDISRLDAGVVEASIERVDLHMLLGRLAGEYVAKAEDKGLELRVAPRDLHALADPGLLERALRNLLENALRNTAKGGVLIGLRRRGDRVRIDVVDTGVGVPDAKREEIFDEFIQLNNPGRDLAHGLGLGLAIVARLAALMGAKIEVASRLGRGSRFSLSLPLIEPEFQPVEEPLHTDDPGGRVLIVEDNAALRHGLDALTRQWGYQPLTAADGEEALKIASADDWRFDAVVTDYRLGGGLTGLEVAKEIGRRSGRLYPTLILTGDTGKERISEISASGFELLHKPVDAEHLRRKLAQLIRA